MRVCARGVSVQANEPWLMSTVHVSSIAAFKVLKPYRTFQLRLGWRSAARISERCEMTGKWSTDLCPSLKIVQEVDGFATANATEVLFMFDELLQLNLTMSQHCSTCTSTAIPKCKGCNLSVDIITTSSTSWNYFDPAIGTPYLQEYLHFTAYTATSTSMVAGTCVRSTSSPVHLVQPHTFPVPFFDVYNPSVGATLMSVFYSSFYNDLGYEGCAATALPSLSLPSIPVLAAASATTLPSATSVAASGDPAPVGRIRYERVIIISIIAPSVVILLLLACFFMIRSYRKKRRQAASIDGPERISNVQLYVDQKPELEDQERRKHELDAQEIRYEMEGGNRLFEISEERVTDKRQSTSDVKAELRGEKHSQELDLPAKAF